MNKLKVHVVKVTWVLIRYCQVPIVLSHHDHAAHEDEEPPDARDDALLSQHVPMGRSLCNVSELGKKFVL